MYFRPHNLGRLEGINKTQIEEILEGQQLFWLSIEQVLDMVHRIQPVLRLDADKYERDEISKG